MMPPPTVGSGLQPAVRAVPLRFHPALSASQSFHQRLHGRDVTSVDGIAHQHGRGRIVDILARSHGQGKPRRPWIPWML